jgi:signal transduction histidine kinase
VAADLNELVESAARVAAPLLRGRLRLERDYGDAPPVVCAPQQLKQLFLNLIVAAARAEGADGALRLATAASEDGARVTLESSSRRGGPDLASDELGAAICQQIVAAHGGELRVEPAPGGATRVEVRLPAGGGGAATPPAEGGA